MKRAKAKAKTINKSRAKRQSPEEGWGVAIRKFEMKVPDKCATCGRELLPRGEFESGIPSLMKHADGTVDEILECSMHHMFKVVYVPVSVVALVSEGAQR